jgi:hypothetical protein
LSAAPRAVVFKSAPQCSRLKRPSCVVCGADLRGDHALGELVCDCHPNDGYNPRHDPKLDEHILVLLYRADGAPLNLYRALGCTGIDANYHAIKESVQRLNASGLVRVVGAGRAGRKLAPISPGRSGRMVS